MTRPDRSAEQPSVVGYVTAALLPIALAALVVPLRDEVVSTNLALILVLTVVLAAVIGGRGPGVVAAIVATVSYDYFLTKPYLSFRVDSADEIETTILLLVIGLIVGQLTVVARRRRSDAARGSADLARLRRVATLVAGGPPVDEIVDRVRSELVEMLDLLECTFEEPPFTLPLVDVELPCVERTGRISGVTEHRFVDRGFALPDGRTELPVLGRGTQVARFLLEPGADRGTSVEELVVAVALADQLGAAIAAAAAERAAVRRAARNRDGEVVELPDLTIDLAAKRVMRDGGEVRLTPTEWRIVEVLVRNAGRLVGQTQLLQEVWGPEYHDETNYLRVFMAQVRRKLEPQPSRPRYFITEPGMGYRFEVPAPSRGGVSRRG